MGRGRGAKRGAGGNALNAVNIFGEQQPERTAPARTAPARTAAGQTAPWLTKTVNVTPEDRTNLMRGTGYDSAEYNESLMSALEAQMEYQQNPTPETYNTMIAATGQFEAQKHREKIFNPERLATWEARAAGLGLVPQTPPEEARPENVAIYGTNSLRYMNPAYFATYGDRPENMTTDMKEAVTQLGNGDFQRGLSVMTELRQEMTAAAETAAQAKAKDEQLYQRMVEMGREVAPRVGMPPDYARSDIVRASRKIVDDIGQIARFRARGDEASAKKIERKLIDAMKVGSVPASGRGPGRSSRRGDRVPIMKLNPQYAKEFIDKQVAIYNRTVKEPRFQVIGARRAGQSLGEYTRESIKSIASSARGGAQVREADNAILENVLNKRAEQMALA